MYHYKMSIEDRLKSHGEKKKEYEFIYNVWKILKEEIGKRLEDANRIFITYSSHDRTHSDSIILSIERLLGEERIEMLSPTDCFALLMVSYIHDIGMALNPEDVYRALNSQEFKDYILGYRPYYKNDEARKYIKSVEKIIKNQELENSSSDSLMGDLYYGILLSLQEIFRKDHHLGVEKIGDSIQIFSNYKVKSRIIKHIIKIAKFHGENRENIFKLEPVVNGWTDDEFHPRFLAILLRMGDLFDLNFSRFNDWMKEEIYNKKKNSLCIPYLSRLHLYKDESIVSMFITPKKIKIFSEIVQEDYYLGLEIAQIVSDWFQYIEEEFDFIKQNWMELTEGDFGAGLGKLELYITLNGNRFNGKNKKVSMSYSLNFMNKLTEGTNLYFNKYSFLRELLQNSIDASLLKLWHDIEERFFFYKEKEEISDQLVKYIENKNNENSKNLFFDDINYKIFQNYPITVFLVDDKITNQAFLVFHDYGIGLHEDDIPYLSTIGCNSKEKNRRTKELMQAIPDIFKPAGYFGIGLHSAFSATDQLQFFSFSGNPIHIIIEDDKYNKTGRKIQWLEMVDNNLRSQFLNHEYGTYTAMKIDCDYFYTGKSDKDSVKMVALEEMESAILNLKNDNYEYFNIKYKRLERYDDNGSNAIKKIKEKTLKNSFFAKKDLDIERFKLDIKEESYGYSFQYPNLSIWDKNKKILITFEIALPVIIDNDLFYYESVRQDVLKVYYRFSRIQSLDALFVNQERNSLISNIFSGIKIRIFDHNVNDYLTIDRDRLKVNALDEQYILNLRNKLLNEYYEYLINNKKKILRDLDHKRDIARLLGMAFSLLKVKNAKEIYELLTPFFYSRIRNELIPIKEYILNMRLVDLKNMRLKSPTLKTIFTENYKFNYELPIKKI